jgi:hypothetical protein
MKNVKLLLIIIVGIMLESCYPYKIQVVRQPTYTIYSPMYKKRRLSMWREHYGVYYNERDAAKQIEEWKQDKKDSKKYRNPTIIRIR